MKKNDPAVFHRLYGNKKPRISYDATDFIDYVLMILFTGLVTGLSYGSGHVMSIIGFALCAFTLLMFTTRHGIEFRVPLILRRPQEVLYTLLYKLQNLTPLYFMALGLLLLENLAIAATPNLPHHVELMRKIAFYLFYIHFISITAFRTVILIDHLRKKELVREILMQTPWKRMVNEKTNITLEIVHAYCTGVLAHIILIAPCYLVITYSKFSLIFLPVVCVINAVVHMKWLKAVNAWFYRDHWLAHNSEFDFIFLHGAHHDAIPSGLIAGAEHGFLEGFLRFTLGTPVPFYNPVTSFLAYTAEIEKDIEAHQYIPGVFPRIPRRMMEVSQHSTHHYGPIEPYSFGIKVDQPDSSEDYSNVLRGVPDELRNSAKLDEELTGFKWNNPTYRRILSLYDKYQH